MTNSNGIASHVQYHIDDRQHARYSSLPLSLPVPSPVQTLAFWRAPHAYLELCQRRIGSRFTIYPFRKPPMVFMSDPSDIGAIVGARPEVLHPGAGASVIEPLVGAQSFMLLEEQEHLEVRKVIMPAFHDSAVAGHTAMVKDIAQREIATWPTDGAFAAHTRLRSLTLRVVLTAIFGAEDPRLSELHLRLLRMLSVTGGLALQEPQLRSLPRWRSYWRSFLRERAHVDHLLEGLIADEVHGDARSTGLLTLLQADRGDHRMSAARVRDNLMSVIVAGHETTASELAWALQLLAHDARVLSTLRDELDRGGESYLLATIREVMRHRPVFLFTIPRAVARTTEIAGTFYEPPAQLVGCIYLMHHQASLFPEPERFHPERFIDRPPDPRSWLPWGGGPKRCIGHRLATLEMQAVLRELVAERVLRPADRVIEPPRWRSVIVTPGRGCRILLRARKGVTARATLRLRTPVST